MTMNRANLIDGEKLQFGNPKHIAYVKHLEALFSGEKPVHNIAFDYAEYHNGQYYACSRKEADTLRDIFKCPKCKYNIRVTAPYYWGLHYQCLVEAANHINHEGLQCPVCKLEFYVCDEEDEIFIKTTI